MKSWQNIVAIGGLFIVLGFVAERFSRMPASWTQVGGVGHDIVIVELLFFCSRYCSSRSSGADICSTEGSGGRSRVVDPPNHNVRLPFIGQTLQGLGYYHSPWVLHLSL